jgi:Tn3 transposase DDE domain
VTPPEAESLRDAAYDLLPRIKITDLLLEVDRWTGFSECFTHQRNGQPAENKAALLTTILADGINLGLSRMAEACRGATLRQLAWVHDWHIREETYAAALSQLINAHRTIPLAELWGTGTTASPLMVSTSEPAAVAKSSPISMHVMVMSQALPSTRT